MVFVKYPGSNLPIQLELYALSKMIKLVCSCTTSINHCKSYLAFVNTAPPQWIPPPIPSPIMYMVRLSAEFCCVGKISTEHLPCTNFTNDLLISGLDDELSIESSTVDLPRRNSLNYLLIKCLGMINIIKVYSAVPLSEPSICLLRK